LKKPLSEFKVVLEKNEAMNDFDPAVFENMIEKIIIGEVDEQAIRIPTRLLSSLRQTTHQIPMLHRLKKLADQAEKVMMLKMEQVKLKIIFLFL